MATVGHDFAPYAEWMDRHGVPRNHIRVVSEELRARPSSPPNLDDNQITAFHPGAMGQVAPQQGQRREGELGVAIGIVSPDGLDGMIQHAEQFVEAGPSRSSSIRARACRCSAATICAASSSWLRGVTVNDYEWNLIAERTGWSVAELASRE